MPLQAVVNVARPFCFLEPGAPNEVLACFGRTRQKEKGKSSHWHRTHPFISQFTKKSFWLFVDICEMNNGYLFERLFFFSFFCSKTKWSKIFPRISFIGYKFRVDLGAIVACFIMHDAFRKLFSVVMKDREIFFLLIKVRKSSF